MRFLATVGVSCKSLPPLALRRLVGECRSREATVVVSAVGCVGLTGWGLSLGTSNPGAVLRALGRHSKSGSPQRLAGRGAGSVGREGPTYEPSRGRGQFQ
jgi:hypothetical protein